MRRPNKRQRKKNAKRDGTWIKQPAGRRQRFRKTSRGRLDSAPVTGKWKTIICRFDFHGVTKGLRRAERATVLAAARIKLHRSLTRYAEAMRTTQIDCKALGDSWVNSPQAEMLRRRFGE